MSEELESILTILVYVGLGTLINLNTLILAKTYGWFGANRTQTIEVEAKSKDNIYTELAAKEYTKAAELNLRAEEIRLERARLENPGT